MVVKVVKGALHRAYAANSISFVMSKTVVRDFSPARSLDFYDGKPIAAHMQFVG